MYSILYVDDEKDLLEITKIFLEGTGEFHVDIFTSAEEVLGKPSIWSHDAIVSDYQMPEMDGITFLKGVREKIGDIPFILFTGRGREEIVIEAINNGADFYLQKGGNPVAQFAELTHKLRQAIEKKRSELLLQDSRRRLSDIIDFLPDATFVIDRSGTVIAWNRAIEEMTGILAKDMIGKGNFEYSLSFYGERRKILIDMIFEPEEVIQKYYTHIIREKDVLIADTSLPHPKGKQMTVMAKASPLYDHKGEIVGAIESVRDISARVKVEEELRAAYEQITATEEELRHHYNELSVKEQALRENKERLQTFMDSASDAFTIWDENLNLVDANTTAITYLPKGTLIEDILGKNYRDILPDAFLQVDLSRYFGVLTTGIPHSGIEKIPLATAGPKWFTIKAFPVGKGIGIATNDITPIKKAEEEVLSAYEKLTNSQEELKNQYVELAKSEERLRKSRAEIDGIFNAAPVGIGVVENRILQRVNEFFCGMTGYSHEELEGKRIRFLYTTDSDYAKVGVMREQVLRSETPESVEIPWRRKDGEIIEVRISAARSGGPTADGPMIYSILDVTEKNREHRELLEAYGKVTATEEELRSQYDELAKSEQKIRESEARVATIFRAAPIGIGLVQDREILAVNDKFCEITGYNHEEVIGKNSRFLYLSDEEYKEAGKFYILGSGQVQGDAIETRFLRKDGQVRNIRLFGTRIDPENARAGNIFTVIDITDEKHTEEGLLAANKRIRESEERYHNVVDNSPYGIHFYELVPGKGLIFQGGNPGADRILHTDHAKKIGMTIEEAFPPLTSTEIPENYRRVAEHGGIWQTDHVVYKDEFIQGAYAVTAFQVTPGSMVAMFVDITERTRFEKTLAEKEERTRRILDETPIPMAFVNLDGTIGFWNKRFTRVFGYTGDDIHNLDEWWQKAYPDEGYRNEAMRKWDAVTLTAKEKNIEIEPLEFRITCKDGSERIADVTGILFSDGFLATFIDTTERKRADASLQESEARHRRILESMEDAYVRTNTEGRIIMVNPAAATMYGYASVSEMIGVPAVDLYPRSELRDQLLSKLSENGKIQDVTGIGRRKDDSTFWVSLNVRAISDDEGKPDGIEAFVRDISGRRLMEQAIQEANKKLSLLSSITRHDMLNQLTKLQGFVQLALMKKPDTAIEKYLKSIEGASETLSRQLAFTKTYQDLGMKKPAWFRIADVVERSGFELVKNASSCSEYEIFADPLLERVFFNLFDNALRHGERVTEIRVSCSEEHEELTMIVEDNGIGIPENEKERIFERGFGKHTGLGLFLVKEILAITGISIRENGIPGTGAQFEIRAPTGTYRHITQT